MSLYKRLIIGDEFAFQSPLAFEDSVIKFRQETDKWNARFSLHHPIIFSRISDNEYIFKITVKVADFKPTPQIIESSLKPRNYFPIKSLMGDYLISDPGTITRMIVTKPFRRGNLLAPHLQVTVTGVLFHNDEGTWVEGYGWISGILVLFALMGAILWGVIFALLVFALEMELAIAAFISIPGTVITLATIVPSWLKMRRFRRRLANQINVIMDNPAAKKKKKHKHEMDYEDLFFVDDEEDFTASQ